MLTGAFLCPAGFAGADGRKAELTARRARPQFGAFVFVCLASSLAAAGEVSSPNRAEQLFAWRVSVRRGNKHTLLAQSRSHMLYCAGGCKKPGREDFDAKSRVAEKRGFQVRLPRPYICT